MLKPSPALESYRRLLAARDVAERHGMVCAYERIRDQLDDAWCGLSEEERASLAAENAVPRDKP